MQSNKADTFEAPSNLIEGGNKEFELSINNKILDDSFYLEKDIKSITIEENIKTVNEQYDETEDKMSIEEKFGNLFKDGPHFMNYEGELEDEREPLLAECGMEDEDEQENSSNGQKQTKESVSETDITTLLEKMETKSEIKTNHKSSIPPATTIKFNHAIPETVELSKIIIKFCKEEEFDAEDFNLTSKNKKIFKAFVKSKLKLKEKEKKSVIKAIKESTSGLLAAIDRKDVETFNHILQNSLISPKRNDEMRKYIFKNVNKIMKKVYRAENGLDKNPEAHVQFWKHYFGTFSDEKNCPIDFFFDPLNKDFNVNPQFKNLTKEYFAVLFANEAYREKFFNSIEMLLNRYDRYIEKKIWKMFEKYDGEEIEGKKLVSAWKKRGAKLPWTKREVRDAISFFMNSKKWKKVNVSKALKTKAR